MHPARARQPDAANDAMGSKPDIPSFLLPDNYTSPSWPSLTSNTQLYLLAGACRGAPLGRSAASSTPN